MTSSRASLLLAAVVNRFDHLFRLLRAAFVQVPVGIVAICWVAAFGRKSLWLIAERPDEARDNGVALFSYASSAAIGVRLAYAIDGRSADASKLVGFGGVVQFGSLRHRWLFAMSSVAISTHVYGASPDGRVSKYFRWCMPRKVIVNLKHGIAKDSYRHYMKSMTGVDLMFCGAVPEYDYLSASGAHPAGEIVLAGLARYDRLVGRSGGQRKQILVMPTFRKWIATLAKLPQGYAESRFRDELIYLRFQSLLDQVGTSQVLEEFGYDLVFYPHYSLQQFAHCFEGRGGRVRVVNRRERDLAELIEESAILVTDYSSVAFDFAYVGRPLCYFQFDEVRYRDEHYSEGYFDYRRHGFGPVLSNENEVVSWVRQVVGGGAGKSLAEYELRARAFFPPRDGRNCMRICDAIRERELKESIAK